MKATIIGAGISGLTAAIALQQAGIDFEIYEGAEELKPVGAGIVMASNAMQVFQRLNVEKKIRAAGLEITSASLVDQSFKLISEIKVQEKVTATYGIGSYAIHRGRLQEILLNEIDSKKINLNKRLSLLIQHPDKIELKFEDGVTVYTDLVIGADGIKSAVRKNIFGDAPLRYSGQTCWRGMANFSLPPHLRQNSFEMWGDQRGLRFGFAPTAKNEVYFFATNFTEHSGIDKPGTVKAKLLSFFSKFGELPLQIIEATPAEQIIRSDIYDFKPIKHWWKGRVVLIGDAAHATTPNLGQGGCQAVEDAYIISTCLKEQTHPEKAYEQYQRIRFAKANHVVNMSWNLGKMTNIENPILRSLRNSFIRMIPESIAIRQLDKVLKLNY